MGELGHHHDHDAPHGGHGHHHVHGHSHGVVDPSIAATDRGLWALRWSFVGLMVTAVIQVVVVMISGSVGLSAMRGSPSSASAWASRSPALR